MIKLNEIQIDVAGLTSSGKSHVICTIKKALEAEYGCTVLSPDLEQELVGNDVEDMQKPNRKNTFFWINEYRVSDFRELKGYS